MAPQRDLDTYFPTSVQDHFSNSSKFDDKIWERMRELYQDFEMGVATKLRHNIRVWHHDSPQSVIPHLVLNLLEWNTIDICGHRRRGTCRMGGGASSKMFRQNSKPLSL